MSLVIDLVQIKSMMSGAIIVDGSSSKVVNLDDFRLSYSGWEHDINSVSFPKSIEVSIDKDKSLEIRTTLRNRYFINNYSKQINAIVPYASGHLIGPVSGYTSLDHSNNVDFMEYKHLVP
jgi:hypothetical protein